MCQAMAFQVWVGVRWNRSSTCLEISQSMELWLHKPGENNRYYAGSFGLWGNCSQVFLNLISPRLDRGSQDPTSGLCTSESSFPALLQQHPPCGVRSLQGWEYAHLKPISFWLDGTWNPWSYKSQAGFLGPHNLLVQVPLENRSPYQCVHLRSTKEFGLQGWGWNLVAGP